MKDVPFTRLTADPAGATVFSCALCGTRFTHGGKGCGSCPLHAGCDVVSCPQCGHSFPRSSGVVGWIRRVLARIGSVRPGREERPTP